MFRKYFLVLYGTLIALLPIRERFEAEVLIAVAACVLIVLGGIAKEGKDG